MKTKKEVKTKPVHTTLPWKIDDHYSNKVHSWNGHQVFEATVDNFTNKQVAKSNAEFITKVVNNHYLLLNAAKTLLHTIGNPSGYSDDEIDAMLALEKAIVRAEDL